MDNKFLTAAILLGITIHSFLMGGFFHLNRFLTVALYVNPIAAKIDSTLFQRSLHVQSVEEMKARLSLMHDLSPYIFRHVDLETFAIIQWCICLLLTTAALFYLGKTVAGTSIAGYGTAILFTPELNQWALGSPAIYINFFHHGLQWAIMLNILSLALLLRKKYLLSFFFSGIAWNFHPMSVLFLFTLYFTYWIFSRKDFGLKTIALCSLAFVIPALPVLIQSLFYMTTHWEYGPEWFLGVKWNVWFTVFPSSWPLSYFFRAGLYCWLFLLGLSSLTAPEMKKNILLFVGTLAVLCLVGTVFVEIFPIPFIMKMSLWRSSWLYIILSLPCIIHLFTRIWDRSLLRQFVIMATLILLTGYIHSFPFYYLLLFNLFLLAFLQKPLMERRWPWIDKNLSAIFVALLSIFMVYQGFFGRGIQVTAIGLGGVFLFLFLVRVLEKPVPGLNSIRAVVPLSLLFILFLDGGILAYKGGPDIYYHGYRQGEKDPWADIQFFANKNTPKDALFIVPPYMNDFGIYSQRASLGDWAEGSSILYLDNDYAREWLARMRDLGWKTMGAAKTGYNALSTDEIVTTAQKYNAEYIITEKPKRFELKLVYENKHFILYESPQATHK